MNITRKQIRHMLLVLVVTIGTAALSISLHVSSQLDRLINRAVTGGGRRVVIVNGTLRADGSIDWEMPPLFNPADVSQFKEAGAGIQEIAVVNTLPWREIAVQDQTYRPGTVLGTDERYPLVMGLRFVAGSFFSAQDVTNRNRVIVLSERAAQVLFGSASAALGQTIRGDRNIFVQRRPGSVASAESSYDAYTVAGVFKDVTAFERDAYDIPDYIVPYTVMFPQNMPIQPFVRSFVALTDSRHPEQVVAALRSYLSKVKNKETMAISVWEGSLGRGRVESVERVRSTLRNLSLITELFGLAILVVAAFGIVSSMMAEAMERRTEIAIKRALGRTVVQAAAELCRRGMELAGMGALMGFGLSLASTTVITHVFAPFLEALGVQNTDITRSFFEIRSLFAPLAALLLAGLFSWYPALLSASQPIVEGLRE